MKVNNINHFTPQTTGINFSGRGEKADNIKKYSPMRDALTTTGLWFGFGIGLDCITRKIKFFKSPTKNSFAVNGIISLIAGIFAGSKAFSYKHTHAKTLSPDIKLEKAA